MTDKLCIFCTNFRFSKEEMFSMGSTMTGPMFGGGDANCRKGHGTEWGRPDSESDFRKILLTAESCPDYEQVAP